ncbi:MAG: TlpA disulfide reductase family protein [Acidimicrobiales bacterium]
MSDTTSPSRRRPSSKTLYISAASAVAVIAIVVVSILTGSSVTNNGDEPTSALVGKSVATFSLSALEHGTIEAPWKSHHAAVLIFFASTCPPCQGEMPKVARYLRDHNEGSIRVLGIDANDLSRAAAERFVKKDGVTFPIAWDPNDTVTTGIFKFATIPETAFVSAKGVVTQIYFGAIPKDTLAKGIAALRA